MKGNNLPPNKRLKTTHNLTEETLAPLQKLDVKKIVEILHLPLQGCTSKNPSSLRIKAKELLEQSGKTADAPDPNKNSNDVINLLKAYSSWKYDMIGITEWYWDQKEIQLKDSWYKVYSVKGHKSDGSSCESRNITLLVREDLKLTRVVSKIDSNTIYVTDECGNPINAKSAGGSIDTPAYYHHILNQFRECIMVTYNGTNIFFVHVLNKVSSEVKKLVLHTEEYSWRQTHFDIVFGDFNESMGNGEIIDIVCGDLSRVSATTNKVRAPNVDDLPLKYQHLPAYKSSNGKHIFLGDHDVMEYTCSYVKLDNTPTSQRNSKAGIKTNLEQFRKDFFALLETHFSNSIVPDALQDGINQMLGQLRIIKESNCAKERLASYVNNVN